MEVRFSQSADLERYLYRKGIGLIGKEKIRQLLSDHFPEYAPSTISEIHSIQKNSFRVDNACPPAFLKWIPDDDCRGNNEIRKYKEILDGDEICIPALLATIPSPGGVLGVWEWLEGEDLRTANRENIPHAFLMLGKYHRKQREHAQLESDITHKKYESIADLLDSELEYTWAFANDSLKCECRGLLAVLENGFPTLNHGDVHPGNMVFSKGKMYFIDWGYSHIGFNFSDLSYLWDNSICSNCPDGWWMIKGEEAEKSMMAYLESVGLSVQSAKDIMLAVMLRNQLHSYANAIENELEEEAIECMNLINYLVSTG